MNRTVDRWALPLILGLYFLLGFSYTLSNPILESPDELLNYENIRFMVEKRTLPVLHAGEFSKAHHPPLYYVMGAVLTGWVPNQHLEELAGNSNPFWGYRIYEQGVDNKSQYLHDPALEGWPYRDAVLGIRMLRLLSLLMGAGIIVIVYTTTRALFMEEPSLAWGAAALVAFNPMFLFIQGSVHNDVLTNLLAALTIFGVVRYWNRGPSAARSAFIGLVAGLGILTKITFLFLGPVVALAIIVRCWMDRHTNQYWWRTAIKMLAIGGGIVLLIAGWWFLRNQILYGDPTSMELQASIWQPRETAPDWVTAFDELSFLRDSFWGAFGFGQLLLHRPVYTLLWIMDLVAVGGLLLWAARAHKAYETYRVSALLLGVLLVAPLTAFAATFARMTVSGSANFGRYLFTSYAVIAPLLVLGLTEWIPEDWRRPFLAGLTTLFFALAVYGLVGILRPAYAAPPLSTTIDQVQISHPREDAYPGLANLLGFEFSPDSAVPGERFDVTLIWQVSGETEENNSLFVQLVDFDGERIAGRDTHPGLGRYPTSRWQQGEIIQDSIPLYLPTDAVGPQGLSLNIGLRDESGELLFNKKGQDTITLATVRLAPDEAVNPVGNPVQYYLGESVELVGVETPEETVRVGEEIPFTLTWRASGSPEVDYVVFVHLVDENGELVATFDQPPVAGGYPTHLWQAGDTVIDRRLIELPEELPEGSYDLRVGWYRLDDLTRLPVMNDQGQMLNESFIPLFTLKVTR
jgi:4-amino-4-deoxy-L-arabinose transferase-like glycosyltransferase